MNKCYALRVMTTKTGKLRKRPAWIMLVRSSRWRDIMSPLLAWATTWPDRCEAEWQAKGLMARFPYTVRPVEIGEIGEPS